MIRAMLLSRDADLLEGGEELLQRWRASPGSRLWLDIEGDPSTATRELLESLHCDELAINDSFRPRHPPKVEHFDTSTFILFRGITSLDDSLELIPQQIGLWVGEDFLVSLHRGSSISLNTHWEGERQNQLLSHPGDLALRILHYACGRYLEQLLAFEDRLGDLEDGLLTDHSEQEMKELVAYRSRLRRLRRIFNYHKVLAEHIWREGTPFLGQDGESEHFRRDLYDRCERLYSLCQMYYEICGDLVEGYISVSSHDLNQTMKVLTIISALFVPLTFIAGIYGMNFANMPELAWRYGYFAVLGVMAVLAVTMLLLFRRIRWL
ncbi:MAG: magnesium transporter CorA family protein [Halioglobus sp.]|nr:magnesium transporter CorA family protein [Halioglobus sp.]